MTRRFSKSIENFTLKFKKPKRKKDALENKIKQIGYFQLFQYATLPDKLFIFFGVINSIISGLAFTLLMFVFGDCIDGIIEYASSEQNYTNQDENQIHLITMNDKLWIFIYRGLAAGFILFTSGYLSVVLFSYTATRQIFQIKVKFLEKILYQDISWFDLNQCGDISTILTHNLSKMEDGMGDLVAVYLYLATTIVGGIVFSLIKGWMLALVGSVPLFLFITVSFIISWFSRKFSEQEIELYGAAGAIAEEVLTSIKTVVAFEGQEKEKLRYEKHLIKAKDNNIKRGFWNGFGKGIYLFLGYSGFALAFWIGVKFIIEDKYLPLEDRDYTPSSLFSIFFLLLTAFWNWEFMPSLFENFASAVGASQKVFFVMHSTSTLKRDENNGQILSAFSSNITFDNVYFRYPSRPDVEVLQGINLKINKGEIVALVGSSGCGKSTCIQLIQRFYDPIKGSILIDNIDLKDLNSTSLKEIIAVVGQEPALFGTTIYENIRYGKLTATREEIEDAAQKANVHTFILSLPDGYQTLLGERGTQISGGQKQKIAIARALVKRPQILLLDEATSALDTTSEKEVQDSLNSVSETCTTIIVAHRLTTIKQANKIVVVEKGTVLEVGSHTELLDRKGAYYNLVNSQIKSSDDEVKDEEKIISKIDNKNVESIANNCEEEDVVKDGTIVDEKIKSKSLFWKIMKMNSSQWYYVLPGCICAVISGTALPVYAIILGVVMQVLSNQNDEELITGMNACCLYYLILGTVIGTSAFLQSFSLCIANEKLSLDIKSQSFDAMLKQEIGWFDRKENGVGALCSQLSGDAMHIQGVTGYQLGTFCQVFSMLFFSIALSFYSEWRVTLVLFVFSLVIFFVSYFQQKMLEIDAKKNRKMLETSVKLAVEAISNIRTVASLGCEKVFLDQYVKELQHYQKVAIKRSHIRGIVIGLVNSLIIWLYPLGLWYGEKLIITENIEYGKVFTVCEIMMFGLWGAGNMMAVCPNFQKGLMAASRVIRLLERVPDIRNSTNPLQISWENETVDYSKIYFSYPTRPSKLILNELSLTVAKGKTVALVGSSGCGKSTIIQLLQRFYDPNSGKILINGTETKQIDLKLLRSQWGVVSQEPNLFDKTIAENIAYGANFKTVEMDAIIEASKDANIHNFIASLPKGYETTIGSKGSQLSGGQKQRIAIARALVRNPKILLLDEATSALDTDSEKVVQEALDKARKGRTCITIAHRLTTIQDADIICVLNDGVIVEIGTHEELFKMKGLYHKFYRLQSESVTN